MKFMNQHAWQKTQKEPSGEGPGSCSRKAGKEGRGPGGCGCGAGGETSYSSGGSRPDLSLLFSCRISPVLIDHGKKLDYVVPVFLPSFFNGFFFKEISDRQPWRACGEGTVL